MNRSVVIVGGSKGIGNAILNALPTTDTIYNLSRSKPEIIPQNVTHFTFEALSNDFPKIEKVDHLIYCPGSITLKPISNLTETDFKNDFEINVLGAVRTIKHFLPMMKKSSNPSILLFSTVAVKLGMPYHASITVAKAGVEGLVKSLGAELAPSVRINAIAPTITRTNLSSKLLRNEKMINSIEDRHPSKKILNSNEVANMAIFLLSEKAASMSGQIFEMDYGIVTFKI
jgi:NAD(P)-dependent dehydrogenase (short-subunit alcohol dehydrogenase family)